MDATTIDFSLPEFCLLRRGSSPLDPETLTMTVSYLYRDSVSQGTDKLAATLVLCWEGLQDPALQRQASCSKFDYTWKLVTSIRRPICWYYQSIDCSSQVGFGNCPSSSSHSRHVCILLHQPRPTQHLTCFFSSDQPNKQSSPIGISA